MNYISNMKSTNKKLRKRYEEFKHFMSTSPDCLCLCLGVKNRKSTQCGYTNSQTRLGKCIIKRPLLGSSFQRRVKFWSGATQNHGFSTWTRFNSNTWKSSSKCNRVGYCCDGNESIHCLEFLRWSNLSFSIDRRSTKAEANC